MTKKCPACGKAVKNNQGVILEAYDKTDKEIIRKIQADPLVNCILDYWCPDCPDGTPLQVINPKYKTGNMSDFSEGECMLRCKGCGNTVGNKREAWYEGVIDDDKAKSRYG